MNAAPGTLRRCRPQHSSIGHLITDRTRTPRADCRIDRGIGSAGNDLFSSANREAGGEVRERGMSQVALWLVDRESERGRAIVWAHNLHVAKSPFRMPGFAEGERRVVELRREMSQTAFSDVGVFLAEEMTRAISSLTSIRARSQYGFRVIDPPSAPDIRSWPPRTMFMILAGLITGLVELGILAGLYLRGVVGSPAGGEPERC